MAKELTSQSAKELNQKIQERYGIGRAIAYKRLRHLGIESNKQNGEVWLETTQIEALDQLNQHLTEGGKLEDYISVSSGQLPVTNGQPSVTDHCSLVTAQAEASEIGSYQTPVETIHAEQIANNEDASDNLEQNAQAKATGKIVLENILVQKYLDNPDLLPPELREVVAKSEALATPKPVDPWQYAQEAYRLMSASA